MRAHWEQEKDCIDASAPSSRSWRRHAASERAERDGDLEKAAELRFGRIVELERQLEEENARPGDPVGTEDVERGGHGGGRGRRRRQVDRHPGVAVDGRRDAEADPPRGALHERVVGQDAAVTAVANAIRRARAGLQDPNRPIGLFLFLGPTGVGKTESRARSRTSSSTTSARWSRIDMSEYQERHTVSRTRGRATRLRRLRGGWQLTETIRRRPYSVVLLDEIEKAHSDVFNVLLQLLDDGRLTDGQGRTVDFRNTTSS